MEQVILYVSVHSPIHPSIHHLDGISPVPSFLLNHLHFYTTQLGCAAYCPSKIGEKTTWNREGSQKGR